MILTAMSLMACWEGKSNALLSTSPPPSSDSVEVERMKDVQGA